MGNLLYLGYFILKTDYSDLGKSLSCCKENGHSTIYLIVDMIYSTIRYGSSFVDYFNFKFFEKKHDERNKYATMGFMYQFHKTFNDKTKIKLVDDKELFPKNFGEFCSKSCIFNRIQKKELHSYLNDRISKKIVIKDPKSTAGRSIEILLITKDNSELLIGEENANDFIKRRLSTNKSLYVEDFVQQHADIEAVSPSGLNTIRIITIVDENGNANIIGSVFRISVDSPIDNYSAGNLAAEVNSETGVVVTGGICKRASCGIYHDFHPITKTPIKGFQLPFWSEVKDMVKEAAKIVPEVRTIGWDVAITDSGPLLIEGNSQWNKDTWQIPAGYGKKHIIEAYY